MVETLNAKEGHEMRVLIACEFSGVVRGAFSARGHDATSCDLLPSVSPGKHYQGDVRDIIGDGWDMMIAHPPCTHLCSSGARWWKSRRDKQDEAIKFCIELLSATIPRICIENPVGILSTVIRKPDQIIQPWQFGHGECKATCLWLVGLPLLAPTDVVSGRLARIHKMPESKSRQMLRSITYAGIAEAMADQWGGMSAVT